MAWDTDLVLMVRVLIGDINTPQKNTDEYLERVIITAGILTSNEISLTNEYVFDISNLTISPDPVIIGDIQAQALFPLKAACIMNQSNFQTAIGQGIRVRDGDSAIDTSVSFKGYRDILELGPCATYEKLRWEIQASNSGANGGAVLSPYRGANDSPIDTVTWFYDEYASFIHGRGYNSRRF